MDPHPEQLAIAEHHDVYPGIDLNSRLKDAAKGKIVYTTCVWVQAEEMEKRRSMPTYAQAGTSGLFVTARSKETLASVAEKAQKLAPTVAIKLYAVDVTDAKAAGESVKQCAESRNRERWLRRKRVKIGDADPEEWWMSMIVNIRGTFNVIHHTIKHLVAATGHAILVSSIGAQIDCQEQAHPRLRSTP
ncbi:hypothetical protein GLOTRDRAFT_127943 [Gloeophyllum trabeum ATCC 11539]|uniref:Uncharacterized protein n=1 Tax=Gloeophyllum trabeum (strain ATCC 11539 / FP-39264 / Madison 617) TaxID=670483 RepID=S7RWA8_GLOTA|nr:uncharacterized protein GLOTRDRAFT_127943 [Gloeophyllum trabeum ATCC 11539]EPQ57589.1 hypothetical protein GLOTRDRAFT_127943 [Gloeophyllum trabeum ATCC 11539]